MKNQILGHVQPADVVMIVDWLNLAVASRMIWYFQCSNTCSAKGISAYYVPQAFLKK